MVALTATATQEMQQEIGKLLSMKKFQIVCTSVDRPNIKYSVNRRLPTSLDSFEKVLKPYIQEVCDSPNSCKRSIIYCKLKWCGHGYEMACRTAALYTNTEEIMQAVSQYHAPCTNKVKSLHKKNITCPN